MAESIPWHHGRKYARHHGGKCAWHHGGEYAGIMVESVLGTIWTWPKTGLAVRHSYIQNNGFSLRLGGELFSFNPT